MKHYFKWLFVAMFYLLLTGILAGCSEKKEEPEVLPSKKEGAYIEEEVPFPEAIQSREMGIYTMLLSPEGELVLYAGNLEDGKKQQILRYTLCPDDTWKEETEPWMEAVEWNQRRMAGGFSYDEEGNLYITALCRVDEPTDDTSSDEASDGEAEEQWVNEFYRVKAGSTDLETLTLPAANGETIGNLVIGPDGKVIQQTAYSPNNAFIMDLSSGKILGEFFRERGCPIWYGKQILTLAGNDSKLLFLNGDTGETEQTVMIREEEDDGGYYSTDGSSLYAEFGTGIWLAGKEGLLYLAEGGSKWEVLLEAEQSVMGMPSYYIGNLLKAGETTFYLNYINSTMYQSGLVRIRYQEGVSAEPDKLLSIYSLEECESVRQAVVEFQREHRDVRVEYRAVMSENSSATKEDCIQAFHTELLGGKGADLIITDSLPIEAYIENGILEDLSGLTEELIEEELLLGNLAQAIKQEGKVWYLPTHMKVPLWIGSEQALQSVENIETLAQASAQAEPPYFGVENYDYQLLFWMLYELYGSDLIVNGEVSQEAVTNFYQSYASLAEQSATEAEDSYIEQSSISSTYGNNGELGYFSVSMRLMLMTPEKIMRDTGLGCQSFRNSFQPVVSFAVNHSSEQKELAYAFIKKMLSASIQETDLDGLPVNPKVVEEMPQNRQENTMTGADYYELLPDGKKEFRQIMAECPTEEEVANFVLILKNLNQVLREDEQVRTLLEAELPALWKKEKTVEAVSETAYQKLKNYLAE